jgi:hypothetical protein
MPFIYSVVPNAQKCSGTRMCTKLLILIISHVYNPIARSTYLIKLNSGASVRQRTIPTERPPLVGEVSANFSG